jgi:hypothetical protein
VKRAQRTGHRQRGHGQRQRHIDDAHRAKDRAVADPVAGHPDQWCEQGAEILQRPKE